MIDALTTYLERGIVRELAFDEMDVFPLFLEILGDLLLCRLPVAHKANDEVVWVCGELAEKLILTSAQLANCKSI